MGLTTRPQPTLYWFVSDSVGNAVVVAVRDDRHDVAVDTVKLERCFVIEEIQRQVLEMFFRYEGPQLLAGIASNRMHRTLVGCREYRDVFRARVNGKLVPLKTPLANGDMIEIMTGSGRKPSRDWLNKDLGFSPEDRVENIRRIGEVAHLFNHIGCIVITAFISPYQSDRDRARAAAGENFHEIHIEADLETCEVSSSEGVPQPGQRGSIEWQCMAVDESLLAGIDLLGRQRAVGGPEQEAQRHAAVAFGNSFTFVDLHQRRGRQR